MIADDSKYDIFCQQLLMPDASVFSIQWTVFPEQCAAKLTPDFILEKYLSYLQRFTFSMVRPHITDSGLEFRLFSTKLHLLAFAMPRYSDENGVRSVTLHICGGPFVQSKRCDRGSFSFLAGKTDMGISVTLQLSDYHPRLLGSTNPGWVRKLLYRLTQAYMHKIVTVRFLSNLYRELTGEKTLFRVVKARVRSGEDI